MKIALKPRAVLVVAVLALFAVNFNYLTHAAFTSPLTVNVDYPLQTIGPKTIGGSGTQQVFREGGPASAGIFAGLDPKAGTCPPGGAINFLSGSTATVGASDFVYAIKVSNSPMSNINLDTLLTGLCEGHRPITSVGACQMPPLHSPTSFLELATGLDYFFGIGQNIPPGESSTILFYTSPDPPSRQPTSIGTSGIVSQGIEPGNPANETPIYGACPTTIAIDKKIGCAAGGPFFDNPISVMVGGQVFYQITVTNTGGTPLDNVVITDAKLKAGGNLTGDFTFPGPAGHLNAGQSVTHVFGPFTATNGATTPGVTVNGTNTAGVTADYLIPNQNGTPSGQTFPVSASDSVSLNVLTPGLDCQKTVSPTSFASLPVTLNYTLKSTNTGTADLSVTIDDLKLKAIIAAPPAGITVNAVVVHSGAGFASGTTTGGNFPANFADVPPAGMAQVDVTLTVTTVAGWQALANGAGPPASTQSTNTMTASGSVVPFPGCSGGTTTASCSSVATVTFTPPCTISLTKQVACGTAPAPGDFAGTATALKNAAIVYRYTVTNPGTPGLADTLNNVVITDNQISSPLFNVGTLAPGQSQTIDVPALAPSVVGPLTNTASASGTCATSGGQATSALVSATVNVISPQVGCSKLVNGAASVPSYIPGSTLTYTLTATNAAGSGTPLDLTVSDPLLSSLPGVTCKLANNTPVTMPFTFTNVAPGDSRTITCTVSFATVADFKSAAGGGTTLKNTMAVSGALPAGAHICAVGTTEPPPYTCSSMASVTLLPPPVLTLTNVNFDTSAPCINPGVATSVTVNLANGGGSAQPDNPGPEFSATLPNQLVGVPGSCTSNIGSCTVTASQVTWNGAIPAGQTVTITYKVQPAGGAPPNSLACITSTANFDSNNDGTNDQTVSSSGCIRVNCTTQQTCIADTSAPGLPFPPTSSVNDQKAGSVLVYNLYTSSVANPAAENTKINLTNAGPCPTFVHLFFIDGATCTAADAFVCLTANQTTSFLVSDFDPGVMGYIVAVASDRVTGCPIVYNNLIGDEFVKLASGHSANLGAEAFAALPPVADICSAASSTATLQFDGVHYNQAPRTLALDSIASPLDGNSTLLVLNSLRGDLTSSVTSIGPVFGVLYDDVETAFSFTFNAPGCQFKGFLSNSFPRTTPRLNTIIPNGSTGWMKLSPTQDIGILGTQINFNPNAATTIDAFNGGHNLHKLTLTSGSSLIVPVFPPSC